MQKMMKLVVIAAGMYASALLSFGATETVDGITWTYTIRNGEAWVGTGGQSAIPTSTTGAITIPSLLGGKLVVRVNHSAFYGCSSLTSVMIPSSVTSIGWYAFYGCSGLNSVTIPNGVESIGYQTFYGCSGLTSVTIPSSVTSIDEGAFSNCGRLNSIIVMAGNPSYRTVSGLLLTRNGKELVAGINGDVSIPDCVTSIGPYAFSGYSGLTSVTIPDSVKSIGDRAFIGCIGLTSVTIPDSVTSIGYEAFGDCSSLTSVTIPGSVEYIDEGTFAGCTGLTSVTIGDGVIGIGDTAFYGCSGLESVRIPNSVKGISGSAFADCYRLYDTTTISGVKLVDGWAVGNDGSLSGTLNLTGVRGIADGAFSGCSELTSVTIGDGVIGIGSGTFSGCGALTSVRIPNSVERISYGAFSACDNLFDTTTIPGVMLVDGWAVGPADDLGQELDLTGARGIANSAFECVGCLTNVIIPGTVKNIGSSAFAMAIVIWDEEQQAASVTISEGVERIGDWAFFTCGMRSVTIPSSVTHVGEAAFGQCFDLTAIEVGVDNANYSSKNGLLLSKDGKTLIHGCYAGPIPDGVENIGRRAFPVFPDLWVTVPGSVTNIEAFAFAGSEGTIIQFLGDAPRVDSEAFSDCWCDILVRYGSSGWDVPIPGEWKGFGINYYDAFVFDPNDDCDDWSNYGLPTYTHVNGSGRLGRGLFCFRYCVVDREDNHIGLGSSIQVEYRMGDELEAVGADVYIGAIRGSESGKGWQTASIPFRGIPGNGEVIDLINVFFADREDARLVMTDVVWKWLDDPVTVRFEACGGKLPKGVEEIAVYDEKYERLPMPTREGCEFIEWSEKPYLSCEIGSEVYEGRGLPASSNVTIYALWKVPWKTALDPDGDFQGGGNKIEMGADFCIAVEPYDACEFDFYGAYACTCPLFKEAQGVDGEPKQEYVGDCVKYRVGDDESAEYNLLHVSVRGRGTLSVPMSCDGIVRVYVDGKEMSFPEAASEGFEVEFKEDQNHDVAVKVRGTLRESWGEEYYGCSGYVGALRWNDVPSCIVTFNANGGSGGTTRSVAYGSAVGTLPTVTRTGYTFNGWWTASSGGSQIAASTTVTGDVTYYAHWTAATYTVMFNANGGSGGTTRSVAYGSAVGTLPTPTRTGYVFDGWWTTASGGSQIAASTTVTGNTTYYAHWISEAVILVNTVESYEAEADGSFTLKLGELVVSASTPKITIKGLPTGLKYDAKTMTITGKATKPGIYTVTVGATNATVKKAVTATFDLVVPNLSSEVLPRLEQDAEAYGKIACGVAFDSTLVDCSPKKGWTVKVAGLPAGLKYDAKSGKITGVPTKAGTFTVTFTASKKGEKNQIATITLTTEALPPWAQGTFAGWAEVLSEPPCQDDYGLATMTVAANGKVSGKVSLGGTNWTFSAASYAMVNESAYIVEAVAKSGKATMPIALSVSSDNAPHGLANGIASGYFGDGTVTLLRNIWKDKATSAAAKSEIANWEGVYTVSFDDGGYVSLTVGNGGDVKASGKLFDGTAVSVTAPLMYHVCWDGFFTVLCASPSAYKGGFVILPVGFGSVRGRLGEIGACPVLACSRNLQATGEYGEGFSRNLYFTGAYYDKAEKLNAYYESLRFDTEAPQLAYTFKRTYMNEKGKKVTESETLEAEAASTLGQDGLTVAINAKGTFDVAKATKPVQDKKTKEWSYDGTNDGALTLSFAQATGIFKGSYTFWYDYESAYDDTKEKSTVAHTSKKVSFEGIWVQGAESLRGFYLWDATGSYKDPKTGKPKTYKYKESHGVSLTP